MAVDRKTLLADCQRQVKLLEADLKVQAAALPGLDGTLRAEYEAARAAGRVGNAFEIWRGEQATQAAVHWVLGCVFVRFLEDNRLIDPLIAGAGDRGRLAEGREQAFYVANPLLHERDWLLHAFRTVAALPAGAALFDPAHNPAFRWHLSPDAAKGLVQFWRRPDPATGGLAHDFPDPAWDTRFLGDLYQDLSEATRKKYALLQTPEFVEEFILDRTLGEAMKTLSLERVTLIDPTSGSGHFLLGAFRRLLEAWERVAPGTPREALAQRALDQVAGVDLNPFAVAIARFRLLLAALRACGVARLERAPAFRLHVAVGDSLLHGGEPGRLALGDGGRDRYVRHTFSEEDLAEVNTILGRRYAVVVGNPPYITPKDKALNAVYRERYRTCHMKYALSVPFVERFWELASGDAESGVAGWIGQITANSFTKQQFGRKLVEEFFPRMDLTHVVDVSGAYIPGHNREGTPTVILFGRCRRPVAPKVRVVQRLAEEPGIPAIPSQGKVWNDVVGLIDIAGSEGEYVSVSDTSRATFNGHPWSTGGGGAAELKQLIENAALNTVGDTATAIGVFGMTNADDAMLASHRDFTRRRVEARLVRPLVTGDLVRDYCISGGDSALFPYENGSLVSVMATPGLQRWLWASRSTLGNRATFSKLTYFEEGRPWWEWHQVALDRMQTPLTITFPFVATHNHFVLNHGGAVFGRTAPIVKLPAGTSEAEHVGLLGLMNSSTACFWFKQVCYSKDGGKQWHDRFEFSGAQVSQLPVSAERLVDLAPLLEALASERRRHLPEALVHDLPMADAERERHRAEADSLLRRMICLQEELDWRCYRLYGITEDELTYRDASGPPLEPPPLKLGERAFEILLARRMAAGEEETTWFARHGSTPITDLPAHWPADYRALVERRIEAIESDRNVGLIERPEYKRRWNVEPWEALEKQALAGWLLYRLESPAYWPDLALQTTRDLAARAALDPEFAQVAALWAGTEGVTLEPVIRELALGEAVPFLPALRYSAGGREKRAVWERTWELQRREDAIDAAVAAELTPRENESRDAFAKRLAAAQKARRDAEVGAIARPPKYTSADFQSSMYWKMRGALDVPKERFIRYDFCGRDGEDAPLLGWAGWDHLQQAQALSAWYADRTEQDGWRGERLIPLLAGMAELVPWLRQWHNEVDPEFGDRPGEVYASWLGEELQAQGLTRAALEDWDPPRPARGRRAAKRRTGAGAGD